MSGHHLRATVVAAAALLLAGPVQSALVSFPFEGGSGEIFSVKTDQGVTFTVSGGFATYGTGNYTGIDGFTLLNGGVLELDEGATLTIEFPAAVFASVSRIELDVWLPAETGSTLVPAVQLFAGNGLELGWDDPVFAPAQEQHYAFFDAGFGFDARRITIRFEEGFTLPEMFSLVALDNLAAEVGPAAPIPEPSSYLLTAAGLFLIGMWARARQSRATG